MNAANKIKIIDHRNNLAKNLLLIYQNKDSREILKFVLESYYQIKVVAYKDFDSAIEDYLDFDKTDIIISDHADEENEFEFLQFLNFVNDLVDDKKIDFYTLGNQKLSYNKSHINFLKIESNKISQIYKEIREKGSKKLLNNQDTFIEFSKHLLPLFRKLNKNIYYQSKSKFKKYLSTEKINTTNKLYLNYNDIVYIIKNQQLDSEFKIIKGTKFCKEDETLNKIKGCTEFISNDQVYFLKRIKDKTDKEIKKMTTYDIHFKTVEDYLFSKEIMKHNQEKVLAMISCIMSKQLDWTTEATFDKLVAAAYLHKISLPENLKCIYYTQESDLFHLNETERLIWKNYPKDSFELTQQMKGLPSLIEDIILYQNHYTSIMKNFDFQKINQVSAIFIIAKHFTNHYFKNGVFCVDTYFNKNFHLFSKYNLASVARKLNKKAKWKF